MTEEELQAYKNLRLSNIKEDLAISDELQDTLLIRLITKVMDHFTFKYGTPSEKHGFIIEDATIRRYNRRGAESAISHSVEGHSMTFEDKHEFEEWDEALREEFKAERGKVTPGRVMFL